MFGTYSFTPELHDGYPEDEVVMAQANSFQDGTFKLAWKIHQGCREASAL